MNHRTSLGLSCLVVALSWVLCGCGGSDVPAGDTCAPGETQLCLCTATENGIQTCNDNGTGWGSCEQCLADDVVQPPADTSTPDTGSEDNGQVCLPQYEKKCVGKNVHWFDSCGQQAELVDSCDVGCTAGECAQGCVPKESVKCVDGQPHFFDSCGVDGGIFGAKACADHEFCKDTDTGNPDDKFCQKPYYNGKWVMTANPNTKEVCGIASTTYPSQALQLTVEGSNATASIFILGYTVNYEGTVEGKTLNMEGNYTQTGITGTVDHQETIEVVFSSPSEFAGIHSDEFELDLLGEPLPCVVYWNVTGAKN